MMVPGKRCFVGERAGRAGASGTMKFNQATDGAEEWEMDGKKKGKERSCWATVAYNRTEKNQS